MPEDEERVAGREFTRYDGKVVYMHWAVMVVFIMLMATALLLLRDWSWDTFKIRGTEPFIPTPEGFGALHMVLAVLLLVLGLVHVLLHIKQEDNPILPVDISMDFQRSVHALRYVLFLSSWDEKGAAHKYQGHQRMMYVITFYTIALAAVTGFLALSGWGEGVGTFLHVVAGIMVILVFLYRLVYVFRKRDWIAWRSIFITGRMPVWYVKMAHPKWYEELMPAAEPDSEPEQETEEEPPAESEPPAKIGPTAEAEHPRPEMEAAG